MVFGFLFRKKKIVQSSALAKKLKPSKAVEKAGQEIKKVSSEKKKAKAGLQKIGEVTHYFGKVEAAIVKITKGPLRLGEVVYIKGRKTDFKQKVASMQIEHNSIETAQKGDEIGLRVKERVRENDIVFKETLGE